MIFAVFDPSPLTVCINCSFLHLFQYISNSVQIISMKFLLTSISDLIIAQYYVIAATISGRTMIEDCIE